MNGSRSLTLAAAVFCLATPALAASGDVLEIPGVPGDAAARGGMSRVEVLSWSWGASNAGTASAGGGVGKVSVQDLSMTKPVKGTAPELAATQVVSPRDPASGQPTGKRSAGAAVADVDGDGAAEVAAPAVGSVAAVRVALDPAASPVVAELMRGCAKGKHFGSVVLTVGGKRYEMSDATFTCSAPAAGSARSTAVISSKGELRGHVTLIK